MNFTDIVGSVLSQGMTPSGSQRIDNSLNQAGGLDNLLNSLGDGGGSTGGGLLDSLGKMTAGSNTGGGLLD